MKMSGKIGAFVGLVVIGIAGLTNEATAQTNTYAFGDQTCVGTQNQTYTPALTLTPTQTTFNASTTLSSCVSASDPTLTSGSFEISGSGQISCIGGEVISQLVLTWNDGETSTIELFSPIDVKPLGNTVVTSYGSVISGKYDALPVEEVLTLVSGQLAGCALQGVTNSEGPVVLNIGAPALGLQL